MSTYTSEPGTRLAGRYRLVDQVNEGAGWTYWKATDEALARFVSVLTFANGFPRVAETVTAAPDDDGIVARLGFGFAPLCLPAAMAGEAAPEQRQSRE